MNMITYIYIDKNTCIHTYTRTDIRAETARKFAQHHRHKDTDTEPTRLHHSERPTAPPQGFLRNKKLVVWRRRRRRRKKVILKTHATARGMGKNTVTHTYKQKRPGHRLKP